MIQVHGMIGTVWMLAANIGLCGFALPIDEAAIMAGLTPEPQQLNLEEGFFQFESASTRMVVPAGDEHDACRSILAQAFRITAPVFPDEPAPGNAFVVGRPVELPKLPERGHDEEAYVLRVTPAGIGARSASPRGLLYAAQTLRQLARLAPDGRLPCMTIVDFPVFGTRGIYIEGGQERFGRIVDKDYLKEQIRRLAEFKMNTLILECYNLLPFASFPACADEGTLSQDDCREIVAESKRFHVTLVPSLQTLAQANELVWTCEAGVPYRESTAPGLMCPSNPGVYPFIKGLYRDLLTWFDESPILGVGCSEIDMQWQGRYCPACHKRVEAGEGVRDLLLGHAVKCIGAVHEASAELGRRVRPLIWADEFYMYGPGKDWVGIERIPKDTVMGYWKYWPDYAGIGGLRARGYDVLGISAMYNHCFYLADLSPEDPPKKWAPMAQTGIRNITMMLQAAAGGQRGDGSGSFLGTATASFSKHRLRAFDTIWYGFALNGQAAWSRPERPLDAYQDTFTRAFVRHFYDARTDKTADALAGIYQRLDRCKSSLESSNQILGDVVGVYDTQEPGYVGNTLMGAFRRCGRLLVGDDAGRTSVLQIRTQAATILKETEDLVSLMDGCRSDAANGPGLDDLELAIENVAAHAERQLLTIDTQHELVNAEIGLTEDAGERLRELARRWAAHHRRLEAVRERSAHLYTRGDPLGLKSLLADVGSIAGHLSSVADQAGTASGQDPLLDESFATLDPARWIVLGSPRIVEGHLETQAPGGWGRYCGVATRDAFRLDESPLIIELELTPRTIGVDSQLVSSATGAGEVSYRFALCGSSACLNLYTQSSRPLGDAWADAEPGWKRRAFSPVLTPGSTYRLRLELTERSWGVTLWEHGQPRLQPPLWQTGPVPMDELAQTHVLFADVEPENSTGASRWGSIRIWRQRKP